MATSDRTATSSSLPRTPKPCIPPCMASNPQRSIWASRTALDAMGNKPPCQRSHHKLRLGAQSERRGILLVEFAHLSLQCLDVEASGQARDRSGIRRESCCMLITTRHFGGGSDFFCLQTCRPMEFMTMASSDVFGLQACRAMECIPSAIHISTGLSDVGTRVGALRYPRLFSH